MRSKGCCLCPASKGSGRKEAESNLPSSHLMHVWVSRSGNLVRHLQLAPTTLPKIDTQFQNWCSFLLCLWCVSLYLYRCIATQRCTTTVTGERKILMKFPFVCAVICMEKRCKLKTMGSWACAEVWTNYVNLKPKHQISIIIYSHLFIYSFRIYIYIKIHFHCKKTEVKVTY